MDFAERDTIITWEEDEDIQGPRVNIDNIALITHDVASLNQDHRILELTQPKKMAVQQRFTLYDLPADSSLAEHLVTLSPLVTPSPYSRKGVGKIILNKMM